VVACKIDTVALQATGVYWIRLYDILVQHGIQVLVAKAQHTKNLPRRKTDVQESPSRNPLPLRFGGDLRSREEEDVNVQLSIPPTLI
jgi:hypothetical protein